MSAIDPRHLSLRHVADAACGLRYPIPEGWQLRTEELIAPFTRAISDNAGAMIGSGRWDHLLTAPPSNAELIAGAAWLASEYGEMFLPVEGDRVDVVMAETEVAERPAALAGYRLVPHPEDGEPAYIRALVVALGPDLVSFLFAVAPGAAAHLIDTVLGGATPL